MSLYILPENQKLLWDTMNKFPPFQEFGKRDEKQRENWFREIAHQFYENNKFKPLSVQELQQINRETLGYMINHLKPAVPKKPEAPKKTDTAFAAFSATKYERFDVAPSENSFFEQDNSVTRDSILDKKQGELNREFSMRQKEYTSMLTRAPEKEIDFRIPLDNDGPIENMEELIRGQLEKRNMDVPNPSPSPNAISYTIETKINTDDPIILQNTEVLPFTLVTKKKVNWSDDVENQKKEIEKEELLRIREFIIEMKDIVKNLQEEVASLKLREPRFP